METKSQPLAEKKVAGKKSTGPTSTVNGPVPTIDASYEKLLSAIPEFAGFGKLFKINGYLARRAIKDLMERGLIRMVSIHSSQQIPKYKQITPSVLSERLRTLKRVLKAQGQHLPLFPRTRTTTSWHHCHFATHFPVKCVFLAFYVMLNVMFLPMRTSVLRFCEVCSLQKLNLLCNFLLLKFLSICLIQKWQKKICVVLYVKWPRPRNKWIEKNSKLCLNNQIMELPNRN